MRRSSGGIVESVGTDGPMIGLALIGFVKTVENEKKVTNLKPCPFCGSKDIIRTDTSTTCAAQCLYVVSEASVKEWNTRPIEDELRTENKRLAGVATTKDLMSSQWRITLSKTVTKLETAKEALRRVKDEGHDYMCDVQNKNRVDRCDCHWLIAVEALKDIEEKK